MLKGVNVTIPSYKRAGVVRGYDYFRTAKIVIPESQRDDYARHYDPKRLIVIPDDQDGNIPRKRNWILQNIPRPLLMIDDDVECLTMTEGVYDRSGQFVGRSEQLIRLTVEQAEALIVHGFNLAHEWGVVLWGVNCNTDGRNYQQYKPFSLTQVILGPLCGHLEHPLLYDERMGTKEDYDMSLQALMRYQKILRLNKFAYYCKHGDNRGGIVSLRTLERETGWARAIEKKWGRGVIRYPMQPKKMSDILNGNVNVPIAGV